MGRVLVTGGGGYIGSVLIPMLLEEGFQTRAVDRFFFGRHLLPDDTGLEGRGHETSKAAPLRGR